MFSQNERIAHYVFQSQWLTQDLQRDTVYEKKTNVFVCELIKKLPNVASVGL